MRTPSLDPGTEETPETRWLWTRMTPDALTIYWTLRSLAYQIATEYLSVMEKLDGYLGPIENTRIAIERCADRDERKIADIRVTVFGPPPGACPTLVKRLCNELSPYVYGQVTAGTEPSTRLF